MKTGKTILDKKRLLGFRLVGSSRIGTRNFNKSFNTMVGKVGKVT